MTVFLFILLFGGLLLFWGQAVLHLQTSFLLFFLCFALVCFALLSLLLSILSSFLSLSARVLQSGNNN